MQDLCHRLPGKGSVAPRQPRREGKSAFLCRTALYPERPGLEQHSPEPPSSSWAQHSPGAQPGTRGPPGPAWLCSPVLRAACPAHLSTLSSSLTRFWSDSTLLFMLSASSQFCRKGRISLSSSFSFSAWLSITRFHIKGVKRQSGLKKHATTHPGWASLGQSGHRHLDLTKEWERAGPAPQSSKDKDCALHGRGELGGHSEGK